MSWWPWADHVPEQVPGDPAPIGPDDRVELTPAGEYAAGPVWETRAREVELIAREHLGRLGPGQRTVSADALLEILAALSPVTLRAPVPPVMPGPADRGKA